MDCVPWAPTAVQVVKVEISSYPSTLAPRKSEAMGICGSGSKAWGPSTNSLCLQMFNSPNMNLQAGFDQFMIFMPPVKPKRAIQIAVESPWKVPFFLIGTSSMVEFDGAFHLPSFFVQERFQPGKKHGLLGGFLHLFRKG